MTPENTERRYMPRINVLAAVRKQMERNDARWGVDRALTDLLWNAVLLEEVGEASEAIYMVNHERDTATVRQELVDVAAVALAMIEAIDENRWIPTAIENEHATMGSLTVIGQSLGELAKNVLQRKSEQVVMLALLDLGHAVSMASHEIITNGYTPREIEGPDDEAAQATEAL